MWTDFFSLIYRLHFAKMMFGPWGSSKYRSDWNLENKSRKAEKALAFIKWDERRPQLTLKVCMFVSVSEKQSVCVTRGIGK